MGQGRSIISSSAIQLDCPIQYGGSEIRGRINLAAAEQPRLSFFNLFSFPFMIEGQTTESFPRFLHFVGQALVVDQRSISPGSATPTLFEPICAFVYDIGQQLNAPSQPNRAINNNNQHRRRRRHSFRIIAPDNLPPTLVHNGAALVSYGMFFSSQRHCTYRFNSSLMTLRTQSICPVHYYPCVTQDQNIHAEKTYETGSNSYVTMKVKMSPFCLPGESVKLMVILEQNDVKTTSKLRQYKNLVLVVNQFIFYQGKQYTKELVKSVVDVNQTCLGETCELLGFILPQELIPPTTNFVGGLSMTRPARIRVNYVISLKLNVKGLFNRSLAVDIPFTVGTMRAPASAAISRPQAPPPPPTTTNINRSSTASSITAAAQPSEANIASPPSYSSLYPEIADSGSTLFTSAEPSAPPMPTTTTTDDHQPTTVAK